MKAVIIDDELYSVEVLQMLLNRYCPEVDIAGVFLNPAEALDKIEDMQFDLLFLDIEMPRMNGFQFLEKLRKIEFKIIFITAYHEYAIKAFKFNAMDYLLKPLDGDDLVKAILKVPKSHMITPEINHYLTDIYKNAQSKRILLPLADEMVFVHKEDIVCMEANGSYTHVFCLNGKSYLLSKNLREMEEMLSHPFFMRVHASWLVNEMQINRIIKTEGLSLEMSNKMVVPISRNRRTEILDKLKS